MLKGFGTRLPPPRKAFSQTEELIEIVQTLSVSDQEQTVDRGLIRSRTFDLTEDQRIELSPDDYLTKIVCASRRMMVDNPVEVETDFSIKHDEIREIDFHGHLEHMPQEFLHLPRLEHLVCGRTGFIPASAVASSGRIESLEKLTKAPIWKQLKSVSLLFARFEKHQKFDRSLIAAEALRHLAIFFELDSEHYLESCQLESLTINQCRSFEYKSLNTSSLRYLNLYRNYSDRDDEVIGSLIERSPNLESLTLYYPKLGQRSAEAMNHHAALRRLTVKNPAVNEDHKSIDFFKWINDSTIEELDVRADFSKPESSRFLFENLIRFNNLKSLSIMNPLGWEVTPPVDFSRCSILRNLDSLIIHRPSEDWITKPQRFWPKKLTLNVNTEEFDEFVFHAENLLNVEVLCLLDRGTSEQIVKQNVDVASLNRLESLQLTHLSKAYPHREGYHNVGNHFTGKENVRADLCITYTPDTGAYQSIELPNAIGQPHCFILKNQRELY